MRRLPVRGESDKPLHCQHYFPGYAYGSLREEAQRNLDAWAEKNGLSLIS